MSNKNHIDNDDDLILAALDRYCMHQDQSTDDGTCVIASEDEVKKEQCEDNDKAPADNIVPMSDYKARSQENNIHPITSLDELSSEDPWIYKKSL